LEECRRCPALADLLRNLNAPGSGFRTIKCDVWTTRRLSEDEKMDFNLPFKVGSYVDLVYDLARLNSRCEPLLRLAKKLEQLLRPCRVQAQAEMDVRHCLFHSRRRWGYSATIFVHGYGRSPMEAKREWSRAVEHLGKALSMIGPAFCVRDRHSISWRHRTLK
jgi:hypothetical protein